ncbi:MAG: hypothetical protein HN932_12930 [Candidatus Marinimicrobia bacterium]|jgi:hypothetical protein|nr:hypothetical protein [Candidatus Neomarinimicrobiota bacterium]MBT7339119.1 hypothetical protein [Candidatus Jacksonbacteria bacterium]
MSTSDGKYWYIKDDSELGIVQFDLDAEYEPIIEGVEEVVTITVSYEYKPAELAIDALTVEPDLPAEVQEALSFYAIYRGYLIKKATSPSEAQHNARQAQIHLTMFNEALRRAQELKNKDKTERIRFIRAPYPFGPAR